MDGQTYVFLLTAQSQPAVFIVNRVTLKDFDRIIPVAMMRSEFLSAGITMKIKPIHVEREI